jgi:hypothetical protein
MQPRPVLLFAFSSCLELKVGRKKKKEKKNCKNSKVLKKIQKSSLMLIVSEVEVLFFVLLKLV